MKWLIIGFLFIYFFEGCSVYTSIFGTTKRETIQAISASEDKEEFLAVLDGPPYGKSPQRFIRIDSNGSKDVFDEINRVFDNTLINFLNDSVLLCQSVYPNKVYLYNLKTHFKSNVLADNFLEMISNDRKYYVTEEFAQNLSFNIYKITGDVIFKQSTFPDSVRLGHRLWEHQFTIFKGKNQVIVNPDFSIIDTIPAHFDFVFFNNFRHRHGIMLTQRTKEIENQIIEYDCDTKKMDTLFSGFYFTNAASIPNSDYLLIQGMTRKEYLDESGQESKGYKEFYKQNPEGCIISAPIRGYWRIGNSKTKKIKKNEEEKFSPLISSSGRHILFYHQYSNTGSDEIKVLSVKELIEGM